MESNDVSVAATAYRDTFGHSVPIEVLRLFERRPGPLIMEIRQAIALGRAAVSYTHLPLPTKRIV